MSSAPKATSALRVLETPELITLIFAFLKDATVLDAQKAPNEVDRTKWKRLLVPLATLNSSFFRATTDLLWEEMESLRPFLAILNPPYASSGSMVCSCAAR